MTTTTKKTTTPKTPSKASNKTTSKKVAGAVSTAPQKASAKAGAVSKTGVPAPTAKGKGSSFTTRQITLLKMADAKAKIANQARVVLEVLEGLGGTATQQEVIDGLIEGGLKTVQTPKRIYTFYRQFLIDNEYIKFV